MSTFRGCESHDFCICHCSVTLPPEKEKESKMSVVLMSLSTIPFFYFFEKPREEGGRILCYLKPVECVLSLLVLVVNERVMGTIGTGDDR